MLGFCEKRHHARVRPQRHGGVGDEIQAEKHEAEVKDGLAEYREPVRQQRNYESEDNEGRCEIGQFERDELSGDGGADIRTQNHPQ